MSWVEIPAGFLQTYNLPLSWSLPMSPLMEEAEVAAQPLSSREREGRWCLPQKGLCSESHTDHYSPCELPREKGHDHI